MELLYYFSAGMFIGFTSKVAADWLDRKWQEFSKVLAEHDQKQARKKKWVSHETVAHKHVDEKDDQDDTKKS